MKIIQAIKNVTTFRLKLSQNYVVSVEYLSLVFKRSQETFAQMLSNTFRLHFKASLSLKVGLFSDKESEYTSNGLARKVFPGFLYEYVANQKGCQD